jgi:hypothetical protein
LWSRKGGKDSKERKNRKEEREKDREDRKGGKEKRGVHSFLSLEVLSFLFSNRFFI